MRCEMCGKDSSSLVKAKVEGTDLRVCSNCSNFGNVVRTEKATFVRKPFVQRDRPVKEIKNKEVVKNYSELIRNARNKSGLDQSKFADKISEKISILQKIEQGHFTPSLKLAHKLEKILNIKLIEEIEDSDVDFSAPKENSGAFTLGDLIKKK